MTVFDTDPKLVWLFCMTHPDDELSIAAWASRLVAQGNPVWMSWTHDTAVRMEEARAAAALIGISRERLFFHHGTDGRIPEEMPALLPHFNHMVESVRPDRVVCGAFEQGHLDHDATNLLVNRVFGGLILEAPFYHTYLTRLPQIGWFANGGGEAIALTAAERALKRTLLRTYPSQRIRSNLMWAELRNRLKGRGSLLSEERLRVQIHKDFLRPNLPPALSTRVERSPQWARWQKAAQAIL